MIRKRGFSLIEVMVASAVLGLAATALFGLFSKSLTNLRKIEDYRHYQMAGEEIMNRVLLLPSLPAGGKIEGNLKRIDGRWVVTIAPWIPADLTDQPADAVMKIDVEVLWPAQSGQRSVKLETVKASAVAYSDFDFRRAIESVFPD